MSSVKVRGQVCIRCAVDVQCGLVACLRGHRGHVVLQRSCSTLHFTFGLLLYKNTNIIWVKNNNKSFTPTTRGRH